MSSSTCGSLSSRLIVGGLTRWWRARTVAIASSAPAPPSRWPVIDLVLVTTTSVGVRAERRVDHQALGDVALRRRGGVGVDVGDVGGRDLRTPQRPHDRPGAAPAGRVGLGDVVGVGGDAGAERPRRRSVAPRALACSSDSRTSTPAPSPSTKPSRAVSHGRETVVGVAVRSSTAPSCWRTPPSAAGGSRPRCRRPARRRPGRAGSGRAPARWPRCRRRRPRPGVFTAARAPTYRLTLAAGALGISIGTASGRPGAGPSRCSTS